MLGLASALSEMYPDVVMRSPMWDLSELMLCAWLLILLEKSVRTARWRHRLAVLNEQAADERQGGAA
jgi:hypothetical protein